MEMEKNFLKNFKKVLTNSQKYGIIIIEIKEREVIKNEKNDCV
jgi:hypothetical protein